jgi:predicted MFS family arabinose efflux permease
MLLVHMVSHTFLNILLVIHFQEASAAPLGAIFGNILSGIVSNFVTWKWVFWVLAILATLVTIAGVIYIPHSVDTRNTELSLTRSVDWIGSVLITVGLMSLLFALSEGNAVGWSTPWIAMLIVIALLLIFIFAAWQWYQEKHTSRAPLLKISLFRNSHFSAAMVLMGMFFAVLNDYMVYATYLWQDYQGLSPIQTMLRFLPGGICGFIIAIIVSRLISKVQTYQMLIVGEVSMSLSCLLMAIPIPSSTSYFAYGFLSQIFAVIGADTAWPCLTLFTSKSLPPE